MNRFTRLSLSARRIAAISGNTFTGLFRMRAFHAVTLFSLFLIGSSVFFARFTFQEEFQVLKDIGLGTISIFLSLLAIFAAARLIPRDIEDRTLYILLAKPVTRFEYLCGKLAGVLLLLTLSLLVMSAVFLVVLELRQEFVASETIRQMRDSPPDQLAEALNTIRASGFSLTLLWGIALIYEKACLLAALTLLVSTFASTTIFTTVVMALVYFIGHLQSTARAYWLQTGPGGWLPEIMLAGVTLIFPDLQLFNVVDDIIAGNTIAPGLGTRLAGLSLFYIGFYLLLAWSAFCQKEL